MNYFFDITMSGKAIKKSSVNWNHFDQKRIIKGWIIFDDDCKNVNNVVVLVNGSRVISKQANLYREDLVKLGIKKDGKAGFFFDISNLILKDGDKISLVVENIGTELEGGNYSLGSKYQAVTPSDTPQVIRRRKFIEKNIDFRTKIGLEVGPFDRPIAKREFGKVYYTDVRSTEELVQLAQQSPGRYPNNVASIDYVVSSEKPKISQVVNIKFDYVIASHVFEHLPNPIGWLQDIYQILNKQGYLFLAIPDKRFIFDVHRPLTTIGEIIEAYLSAKEKPSFKSVFDSIYYSVKIKSKEIHERGYYDEYNNFLYTERIKKENRLISCYHKAQKFSKTEDYSCHCYCYTLELMLEIITQTNKLGLHNFCIDQCESVEYPFNDFFILLKKS